MLAELIYVSDRVVEAIPGTNVSKTDVYHLC